MTPSPHAALRGLHALCAAGLAAVLVTALAMIDAPEAGHALLILGTPLMAAAVVAPMAIERCIHTYSIGTEPNGVFCLGVCMGLGLYMMRTIADVALLGAHPAWLLTLLGLPWVLETMSYRDPQTPEMWDRLRDGT